MVLNTHPHYALCLYGVAQGQLYPFSIKYIADCSLTTWNTIHFYPLMVAEIVNKLHAFDGTAGVPQLSINELYREPGEPHTLSHTPILQDILLFPSELRSCLPSLLLGFRLKVRASNATLRGTVHALTTYIFKVCEHSNTSNTAEI